MMSDSYDTHTAHKPLFDSAHIRGFAQLGGVIVFVMLALFVSNLLHVRKEPLREQPVDPRSLIVDAGDYAQAAQRVQFRTTGLVQARAQVEIVPQVSGRVISVNDNVFAGGTFEAGELLFQIDPADYQLEVKRLRAQVAQAQTAYDLERAERKIALAEWRQLHGKTPAPDLVARKPQMEEAQANLQAAQAQLDRAVLDLERTVFSLSFRGRVLESSLAQGQYITAGQPYGLAYDMEALEVQASVDAQKLSWLIQAARPVIDVTAHYKGEKHHFAGVLARGAAQLDASTRFAQIAVGFDAQVLKARRASESLLPGVFAELSMQGAVLDNVMRISARAIQKDGRIWVIDTVGSGGGDDSADDGAESRLRSVVPQVIYREGEDVLIKAFAPHARLVLGKMPGAVEGMQVRYTLVSRTASAETEAGSTDEPTAMLEESKPLESDASAPQNSAAHSDDGAQPL